MRPAAGPIESHPRPLSAAPCSLRILAIAVAFLFLGVAYQWGAGATDRMAGKRAIGLVQERLNTNLTEGAANTDARSYDWLARKAAPDLYHVKQNLVLDRIWRVDRWENFCWQVRLSVEDVRMVDCRAIRWDKSPQRYQGR